jgi:hypothetical protein
LIAGVAEILGVIIVAGEDSDEIDWSLRLNMRDRPSDFLDLPQDPEEFEELDDEDEVDEAKKAVEEGRVKRMRMRERCRIIYGDHSQAHPPESSLKESTGEQKGAMRTLPSDGLVYETCDLRNSCERWRSKKQQVYSSSWRLLRALFSLPLS